VGRGNAVNMFMVGAHVLEECSLWTASHKACKGRCPVWHCTRLPSRLTNGAQVGAVPQRRSASIRSLFDLGRRAPATSSVAAGTVTNDAGSDHLAKQSLHCICSHAYAALRLIRVAGRGGGRDRPQTNTRQQGTKLIRDGNK
jgi:hypothetical protein